MKIANKKLEFNRTFICFPVIAGWAFAFCSASDDQLAYKNDFSTWYEVPRDIVNKIETNPLFANLCKWEVKSRAGNPIPYLGVTTLKSWPQFIPLNHSGNSQEEIFPDKVQEVSNGWLVAYNMGDGSEVHWFSGDKSERRFVASEWVNQFHNVNGTDDVIAALGEWVGDEKRGGKVVRFYQSGGEGGWEAEEVVDFEFGEVFGVDPNFESGILVFSASGWWSIFPDKTIVQLPLRVELFGNSSTISSSGEEVFIGGEYFIRNLNLKTKDVRVLIPSKHFLDAMLNWSNQKFEKALQFISHPDASGNQ